MYEDTTGLRPGVEVGAAATCSASGWVRPCSATSSTACCVRCRRRDAAGARFRFDPPRSRAASAGRRQRHSAKCCRRARARSARCCRRTSPARAGRSRRSEVADDATVLRIASAGGAKHEVALSHFWPVRAPRPVRARLTSDEPLVTGQRILDSLFPVALGRQGGHPGRVRHRQDDPAREPRQGLHRRRDRLPRLRRARQRDGRRARGVSAARRSAHRPLADGAHGDHRQHLQHAGRRARGEHLFGGDGGGVLPRPGPARRADGGLDSRWAEALREVSGRFGELPGEGGYPTYLASRLADFYERAAKVVTLSGATGSVTLLGSISPPSGDFSEPVTSHSKRYVRSFWALDAKRAQARFYPAVNPLQSYSEDALDVAVWWLKRYAACRPRDRAPLGRERVARAAAPLPDAARRPGAARAHGPHHRQGRAARAPAPDAARGRTRQRGVPAPVGVLAGRPLLRPRAPGLHDAAAGALHRTGRTAPPPKASRRSRSPRST